MTVTRQDIADSDIVDAVELASDGTYVYVTLSVTTTTSGTNVVVVGLNSDGQGIRDATDTPVGPGDIVSITGTSGGLGDGKFTVSGIVDNTSFVVVEAIGTSTGGSASFMYPAGAREVGFDPTGQTVTSATTVQQALTDEAIAFLLENEPVSGVTYSNVYSGNKIQSEMYRNSSNSNLVKTMDYTYAGSVLTKEVRKIYDPSGVNVVGQVTVNNTWSGSRITGSSRNRDI